MRIIAGKFKGKNLIDFNHEGTRPTSDKARGGIFNTLVYEVEDGIFLDLFGGSGAMGIEAESRGAKRVYIVDNNEKSIKNIRENCKKCGTTQTQVWHKDFKSALIEFSKEKIVFDVVFIDPPYKENYGEVALEMLYKLSLLNEDSIVCYEHDNTKEIESEYYNKVKTRKYGIAICDYFMLKEGEK